MEKVDIVIPSYSKNEECKEITKKCIVSLLASEENIQFNVFIIESQPGVIWDYPNTITVDAPLPYGYHKFLNFGRKLGNSEYVCLCNNDLVFTKNWATEIIEASKIYPDVLSFSPICPKTQPLYGINTNEGIFRGYGIRTCISGWCIFQKRKIYEVIGDLDEEFIHWYCDNDYAQTLMSKNLEHYLITHSIVIHHDKNTGRTTDIIVTDPLEMNRLTSGSYEIYKSKWKI